MKYRTGSERPRVCIVRQTDMYEPPVQRTAEALVACGFEVQVLCMRHPERPRRIVVDGVEIISLPTSLQHSNRWRYALDYALFFVLTAWTLTIRHVRRRYTAIQVNTMPDFLVFAAIVPRLLGARVLLFMNEPLPELAETLFGPGRLSALLARVQQGALRFADHTFTVTAPLRQRLIDRGADAARVSVVLNGADPRVRFRGWSPPPDRERTGFTVICHGAIERRYGQDTLIEATHLLADAGLDVRLVLTGRGGLVPELLEMIEARDLGDRVEFRGWVSHAELNDLLHEADVGVVAQRASPYSHLVFTNKMVDYWLFGLPVVASRLQALSELYDESTIEYFRAGDASDLARAILRVHDDPQRRTDLIANGCQALRDHGWEVQRRAYLAPYRQLVPGGRGTAAAARPRPATPVR